jgi:hypothetical protein
VNKTLYVRDEDLPTWEQAKRAAKARGQSLSQFVAFALEQYLNTKNTGR